MKSVYIIDGMALAYRGYFAFIKSPLKNSKGVNTSAVYLFLKTILRINTELTPDELVVVFDSDKNTFRHKMYKEYKAHRTPMPDDLRTQIPLLYKLLEAMKISTISLPGLEADDIISTIASKTAKAGNMAYIISKDKDFAQLVSKNIIMIDPKIQGERINYLDEKGVQEKFGVLPKYMIDYQSLVGDSADNIPGAAKVGPKTATLLLNEYGSVENIYKSIDNITKKALKQNLKDSIENVNLSRKLVTLLTDVDVSDGPFNIVEFNSSEYSEFLKEMDFHELLKQRNLKKYDASDTSVNYKLIQNEDELVEYVEKCMKSDSIAIDTETDGLDQFKTRLVGISLSTSIGEGYYIPVNHTNGSNISLSVVKRVLSPLLENSSIVKVGHNLKFDIAVLNNHGMKLKGQLFDTML